MKSAKDRDCTEAEYEIGTMYRQGEGFQPDYKRAFYWFDRAAGHGNPHAMNWLGSMYASGEGVTRDDVKAALLYEKAEKLGCPYARLNLARVYRFGTGVRKDVEKARSLFAQAATSDDVALADEAVRNIYDMAFER